jgi:hypothetical protein
MLDWWSDLPWWLRLGIAFAIMALGIVIVLSSTRHQVGAIIVDDVGRYEMIVGFAVTGIGLGLAFIGGKSDAEKKGYKF